MIQTETKILPENSDEKTCLDAAVVGRRRFIELPPLDSHRMANAEQALALIARYLDREILVLVVGVGLFVLLLGLGRDDAGAEAARAQARIRAQAAQIASSQRRL